MMARTRTDGSRQYIQPTPMLLGEEKREGIGNEKRVLV